MFENQIFCGIGSHNPWVTMSTREWFDEYAVTLAVAIKIRDPKPE